MGRRRAGNQDWLNAPSTRNKRRDTAACASGNSRQARFAAHSASPAPRNTLDRTFWGSLRRTDGETPMPAPSTGPAQVAETAIRRIRPVLQPPSAPWRWHSRWLLRRPGQRHRRPAWRAEGRPLQHAPQHGSPELAGPDHGAHGQSVQRSDRQPQGPGDALRARGSRPYGGSVAEGERVIDVLRQIKATHQLETVVAPGDVCASMCVFIYVQGQKRLGALTSSWLFHEVSHMDPITKQTDQARSARLGASGRQVPAAGRRVRRMDRRPEAAHGRLRLLADRVRPDRTPTPASSTSRSATSPPASSCHEPDPKRPPARSLPRQQPAIAASTSPASAPW